MASGPALSTAKKGEIYVRSEIRDSLSLLDVVYANQFEGEVIDLGVVEQVEENFYRGAPPTWLNFHISEQAVLKGTQTPFIKRDGYDTLVQQIHKSRKRPGISTVKLFHQPGCGGTTLAMQVLWDLRKTFRCAVLTGSSSDITNVAKEVVYLFRAGNRDHQNTVLLLVNDEQILGNLQDRIMEEISEQEIVTYMPVVILLSCVRKNSVVQSDHVVLKEVLSDTEKQKFNEKKEELRRRYSEKHQQFHGFNIMQSNFSQDYIDQACTVFKTIPRTNKPPKIQLAAFLSLLNAYVPGSYLLESQCLDFLKHEDSIHGDLSLEDKMEPFSHLIITFQRDMRPEKKVCMAHPMIAQRCIELMAAAGVTRSDTARDFLTCFCTNEVPPFLLGFVKDMLTKRETTKENPINSTETKEEQERFSRLILHIKDTSVLEVASHTFDQDPFFPQALARFYYIELKDYIQAERWAKLAKERDPQNSFIADTLGQVHKNHLKNKESLNSREIWQLATKAIEAFKHEEQLAENEHETDMKEDGKTKVSHVFNNRGMFGYLQVCILVYDQLVNQNETWKRVLTKDVSLGSVLQLLGDNELFTFNDLISSLRDEVEKKCEFFEKYLTYSKPDMKKDDPSYISEDTENSYRMYVGVSLLKNQRKGADLIQKLADIFAQGLSHLDREYTESELKDITERWEEIFLRSLCKSLTALRKKISLSPNDAPELLLITLLLCWPTESEDKCVFDLSQLIQFMHRSYEHTYKTYFRSRYLLPLFFIGKGQDLNRIVHRKVLEGFFIGHKEVTVQDWSNEKIFEDPMVQQHLLKVQGVVRNYRVFASMGKKDIEVDANLRNSLWKNRQVSFYLGFTIRGPVAFGIQARTAEKVETAEVDINEPRQIEPELSAGTGAIGGDNQNQSTDHEQASGQHFVDRHQTALINRVSDTETILGKLTERRLISNEENNVVRALKTTQDQMTAILQCLTPRGKDDLYEILKKMKSMRPLLVELGESE